MRPQVKERDPLPDESAPLEEIAEFWDTHDTADYEDAFATVDAEFDIRRGKSPARPTRSERMSKV